MQHDTLTGEQLGGDRLGQQRVPRPVLDAGAAFGEQPVRDQLPKAAVYRLHI
jgi:hypothetical protein